MSRDINWEEKCKCLEDQIKMLEDLQNRTVQHYNLMIERYDNIIYITRKYCDHMEYCINVLEEENRKLKERVQNG